MSKIHVCRGLIVARKVIKELEKIMPKEIAGECDIESWSNCREQGLCIKRWSMNNSFNRRVVIAEARSSDDILVVYGTSDEFDFQTNQPSDTAWESNRKYFGYKKYAEAAKFILEIFKNS